MAPRAKKSTRWTTEAQQMLELLNSLGSTIFRQLLWQRASDLDLTYAQSQVLFRLAEHPSSHMGDVAKAFGVTLPAVTHIVDRLEEKGLVTRGDHPADRRVYVLDLTRAGTALVDDLEAIRLRGMERVLARMSGEDRRRALTGLEALVDAASSAPEAVRAASRRGAGAPPAEARLEVEDTRTGRARGNAQAYTTVGIKSQVNGQIVDVHFKEGQDVRRNDLLFTIDPRPFEAALRQTEAALLQRQAEVQQAQANLERDLAQLENAKVQERRYRDLVDRELIAREQYDQLRTNWATLEATVQADRAAVENARAATRAAQANVDAARLQVAYTAIRAPIDGRTGNLLVQNGNIVKANDDNPIVVINQVHPIYVSFAVPDQHLTDIKKYYRAAGALRVVARLPRQPEILATGDLTFVNNAVDQTTATIQLKATFANTDNVLWPGQFLDVSLVLTTRTAIVIPSQAIQPGQQGLYVYVVRPDQTVESRPVVLGTRLGGETIIEQGLRASERVVTDGQLRLVPGARIEIRPPKAS
ncbi:MAG: efflux RND transporter periplasmic adaptor subunit [Candidatus Rokuibacteriota bacterium]|nr:MAG: efflux RND transporter periplasmic adaptor subunit [Candidatus Rokubacteria bacterium]